VVFAWALTGSGDSGIHESNPVGPPWGETRREAVVIITQTTSRFSGPAISSAGRLSGPPTPPFMCSPSWGAGWLLPVASPTAYDVADHPSRRLASFAFTQPATFSIAAEAPPG
jgi:hypothetical protein